MDSDWVKQAFQYGLPTVLLVALCAGLWRILWAIGTFFAPHINDLVAAGKLFSEKNITFLSKMEVLGDGLLQQQQAQTELMKRHDDFLITHGVMLTEIHNETVKKAHKSE